MRVRSAALAAATMANSRFQYVKKFELPDALMQDTYLITRLDGHRFTKFTADHGFMKPNDERGLLLMAEVMSEWSDLVMAYGQSDEFSFLLPASSSLYGRRSAKLSTSFVSLFSSSFVFFWPKHFPDTPLLYPPNFDARVVSYPSAEHIRDYFGWRQADCHINNLYNTCFWSLVAAGESKQDAQVALKGTTSGDKNELLFSRFRINYNEIPQRFRKGTTLYRARPGSSTASTPQPPLPSAAPSPIEQDGNAAQQNDRAHRETGMAGLAERDSKSSMHGGDRDWAQQGCETSGRGEPDWKDDLPATGVGVKLVPVLDATATHALAAVGVGDGRGEAGSNTSSIENRQGKRFGESSTLSAGTGEIRDCVASDLALKPKTSEETAKTTQENSGAASMTVEKSLPGDGVDAVKVVRESGVAGRGKRLLKKGHAPPGVVEENTCDIIRDDFWDQNPHILAGVERRR